MKAKRQRGKRDRNQQIKYSENQSKILKALKEAPKGLMRSELKRKTHLSYAAIRKHLNFLIQTGQVKQYAGKLVWLHYYIEMVGDTMKAYSQELQQTLASMVRPEIINRARIEGTVPLPDRFPENSNPDAPARIDFMTKKEWKEFFVHKEKVFGGLRRCFFDLAKVVMKADVGFINAEEDLSNVTVRFVNGRAVWSLDAGTPRKTGLL